MSKYRKNELIELIKDEDEVSLQEGIRSQSRKMDVSEAIKIISKYECTIDVYKTMDGIYDISIPLGSDFF